MDTEDYTLDDCSDAELRALEYWERGFGHTQLRERVMGELDRRECRPNGCGQVPGVRGAKAALRVERDISRRHR